MRLHRLSVVALFLAFSTVAFSVVQVAAQQLRIETSVFAEEEESEPMSTAVTLFDSTMVYHFVEKPAQVIIYRSPGANRDAQFIILDNDRAQRTDIATKRISGFMEKLTKWAADQEDVLLRFSAQPMFEEDFDEESGLLKLNNPAWKYTVATVPAEDKEALAKYREFTDWYCQLNALIHNTPPPGARLELNKSLAEHGVVPVEIQRTMESQDKPLRATHLFTWRLSRDDRQRIDDAQRQLASFKKVDNATFIANRKEETVVRGQSK